MSEDSGSPNETSTVEGSDELYDLVVVGGGPAGTATAFRAQELGLKVLVIEYDDLMKRIRDYSKDKLILPGFGGGDKMKFPKGGELINALHFAPIDKDEMCARFKELYQRHEVPTHVGCELTGIETGPGNSYRLLAWDHRRRCDVVYAARHVVLALGRGVPRRFDIPGNCDGISYRLANAGDFLGEPACVIGGGTSAAEAVIAISNAKAEAGDASRVYWSYRGDRLPRVSKALAEAFFGAYAGNGNILYFPNSEPAAVVTAEDRREYLSVRVDRRRLDGRPNETTYLEFATSRCVACIGEDLPTALLSELGVPMGSSDSGRRRMIVNQFLESDRPNLFLLGDLLSPAYLQRGDGDELNEVKHRGNIKSALRDGVLVAEVIAQRLAGRSDIDVHLEDADDPQGPSANQIANLTQSIDSNTVATTAALEDERDAGVFLVRLLPGGVEEAELPLQPSGVTTLGREGCDLIFDSDTMLSPRHASIAYQEGEYLLRDDGSSTGVFLRLMPAGKRELESGDLLRAGRQFLLVDRDAASGAFALTHYDVQGQEIGRHRLPTSTVLVGRQCPDINLDPHDTTLSRRQLALSVEDGRLFAKDLKSANGTYLRVRRPMALRHGDQFRLGSQQLIFSTTEDAVLDTGSFVPTVDRGKGNLPEDSPAGATVCFEGLSEPLPISGGKTLCEVAEAHGLEITAECHSGICGSDPIQIVEGAEHLNELSDQERETLEEICELEAGPCRLACMVRAKGPVKVKILKPS